MVFLITCLVSFLIILSCFDTEVQFVVHMMFVNVLVVLDKEHSAFCSVHYIVLVLKFEESLLSRKEFGCDSDREKNGS